MESTNKIKQYTKKVSKRFHARTRMDSNPQEGIRT